MCRPGRLCGIRHDGWADQVQYLACTCSLWPGAAGPRPRGSRGRGPPGCSPGRTRPSTAAGCGSGTSAARRALTAPGCPWTWGTPGHRGGGQSSTQSVLGQQSAPRRELQRLWVPVLFRDMKRHELQRLVALDQPSVSVVHPGHRHLGPETQEVSL